MRPRPQVRSATYEQRTVLAPSEPRSFGGGGAVRRKESWGRETYQETGVTQLIVTVIATVITTAH